MSHHNHNSTTTTTAPKDSSSNDTANPDDSSRPVSYTPYEQWVRRLYMTNLFHPVKLGLENSHALYHALGRPLDDIPVLHVAGTNGKGSVVTKLATTLQLNSPDSAVGMFVSPHISSFRERLQVNGACITEEEVVEYLPRIYDACVQHDIPATFFEITTALAMVYFQQRQATVVVLETGLGGRLDATNVLTSPSVVLAVITSIGLEHTRILGDTVELIAREKGGIIKPGVPVLVGPHVPHAVLQQCAVDKQASAYYKSTEVLPLNNHIHDSDLEDDDYDLENTRIAQAALHLVAQSHPHLCHGLTPQLIAKGTSVRPPCRFEQLQIPWNSYDRTTDDDDDDKTITVILDVAHNPPAMDYLVRKLHATFATNDDTTNQKTLFHMVVGMSSDKDLALCGQAALQAVQGDASRIYLVEAAHPRAAKLDDILHANQVGAETEEEQNGPGGVLASCQYNRDDPSVTFQIQNALTHIRQSHNHSSSSERHVLVICGSVFLMAEARQALGIQEPRDSQYIAEVAGAGSRFGQENFGNSGGITTLSSSTTTATDKKDSPTTT